MLIRTSWAEALAAERAARASFSPGCTSGSPTQHKLRKLRIAVTTFNRPEMVQLSAWSITNSLQQVL